MCFEGGSDQVTAGTGFELIFQLIDDDPVIGVQPDRDPLLLRLTLRRLPTYFRRSCLPETGGFQGHCGHLRLQL